MRIAFIAMSGIRVCDAELLKLGLTLPGFVERSKTIASLPSLGLLTLAGMTPKRHEIRYLEVADLDAAAELPTDLDLVVISSLSAQVKEAYRLAEIYHGLGIPVVMGGLHVTANPDEPQRHGACAAIGEGEVVWPEILEDAETGKLRPIYDARGRDFDLNEAPRPAFELLDIAKYNRLTVQTSRGCPWKCTFCASSILLTGHYKQKPVERVLAEIDRIRELWPRPFIEFADDNSFVNRRYWRELLPELKKRRIRWFTETDLSVHEDEELLRLMREAGCVEVLIGFESPNAAGLDGLELHRNFKHQRREEYRTAIHRIQKAGIRVNACFVLGLDGHGTGVFDALLDFVQDALPFDVQVTVPTPFPGTPFYEQLKREGRLLEPEAWDRCTLFDVNFRPRDMSAQELRDGLHRMVVELYGEQATQVRREHFKHLRFLGRGGGERTSSAKYPAA
ncbi:MAG: B12-binding domain-containing radical SAM protein [Acidobacteriota bacterium]|nr:B12-binding domain-containing radical SAM protein [Acidobacteriota bacterium]